MKISALYRYWIRGTRAQQTDELEIRAGAVWNDRIGAVVNDKGQEISIKLAPKLLSIAPRLEAEALVIHCDHLEQELKISLPAAHAHVIEKKNNLGQLIQLVDAGGQAAQWFSEAIEQSVRLLLVKQNPERFHNLVPAAPILLIGDGSIEDLNKRLSRPCLPYQFRPNIRVDAQQAFCEDDWTQVRMAEVAFQPLEKRDLCAGMNYDAASTAFNGEPRQVLERYRKLDPHSPPYFGRYLRALSDGIIRVGDSVFAEIE